jgi:arylsulfatase
MQTDRSSSDPRGGPRRVFALVALGLFSLVVVAAILLRVSRAPAAAEIDLDAPTHYFIPRAGDDLDAVSCVFDRGLERGTSHDLWRFPLQPCSLVWGWSNPGRDAVMAMAHRSSLSIFTDRTDWAYLALRVRAEPHPSGDRVQTMRIRLNRQEVGTVDVPISWNTISVPIPEGALRTGTNRVSLQFAYRAAKPPSRKRKSVGPLVAIYLQEIRLTNSEPKGALATALRRLVPSTSPTGAPSSSQIYDRDLERFAVSTAGTLVVPIALPDRVEQLEVEARSVAASDPDIGEVTLNLQGTASGTLVSVPFPAFDAAADRSVRAGISVSALAGESCVLWIDVETRTEGMKIEFSKPELISSIHAIEEGRTGPRTAIAGSDRPDIVLITLDAARPHHFSCYGYDRPTTPEIDRLAAESLVFTNAFALVPNTLRSVPTMMTGMSFLNHQVTFDNSTLDEAATTMAERLADAGYRTTCFSASPNNSRAIGLDQGYEEFFELWNEVPRKLSRDPHYISRRVREWLATVDDGRPLHLQLHFVPPHVPYTPAARFDLFSDPLYQGIFDGSPTQILRIDKGRVSFDADDLNHLIALYDGNLRAADDAVGEVLAALRERPRWRDTVVLVTSDHGEAFYEHRRMGHNKTVYDEMLRVPFILRLPRGIDADDYDLDRLVTLADLTPTLLAAASLEPDTRFDGFDVVRGARLRRDTDGRYFIARTADETPTWGLRSRRFKLILHNSGQGKLFDVTEDPGEQRNLRFTNREVYVGLGLMLTRRLIEPPSLSGATMKTELPESDRKMLEALGYIE